MIKGISRKGRKPSYIPPELFADVFLQIIHDQDDTHTTYNALSLEQKIRVTDLLTNGFKTYLLQKISDAKGDVNEGKKAIMDWFDNSMMRIGGTYKKKSQRALLIISLVLVSWANVDTLRIASHLHENPKVAESIANKAALYVQDSTVINYINKLKSQRETPSDSVLTRMQQDYQKLKSLQTEWENHELPISWTNDPWRLSLKQENTWWNHTKGFLAKLIGLLVSAMAISLGAPFWFEMLNKLVNLRGDGNNPSGKPKPSKS
ncbi:hypothetical protein [Marinoscillum sp.]|uniref:hypothetical protein n=1 Tax=Marinoscillum sp. TaxID=2024838 RepID=UPI003BAB8373